MPSQQNLGGGVAPNEPLVSAISQILPAPTAAGTGNLTFGPVACEDFSFITVSFVPIVQPSVGSFKLNIMTKINDSWVVGAAQVIASSIGCAVVWFGQSLDAGAASGPIANAVSGAGIPSTHPLAPDIIQFTGTGNSFRFLFPLGTEFACVVGTNNALGDAGEFDIYIYGGNN